MTVEPIVYACMIAGTLTLADRPCVDRPQGLSEQNAIAFANLQETPPRLPKAVSAGSSFQVTRHGGYWVRLGTAVPYVHKRGRRGR
jgi:hypothetical protein